jgi:hypothetical protein
MTTTKRKYTGPNFGMTHAQKARKMTKLEAVYFAGLFDGEGCILNSHKAQNQFCLRITVAMCNEEVINHIRTITGCGTINRRRVYKPHHNSPYVWQCHGMNAAKILEQILPWLIVKREKAIEMIAEYTLQIDPS